MANAVHDQIFDTDGNWHLTEYISRDNFLEKKVNRCVAQPDYGGLFTTLVFLRRKKVSDLFRFISAQVVGDLKILDEVLFEQWILF